MCLNSVDFPQPDFPKIAANSPLFTVSETFLRLGAEFKGYVNVKFSILMLSIFEPPLPRL